MAVDNALAYVPEITAYDIMEKRETLGMIFRPRGDLALEDDDMRDIERVLKLRMRNLMSMVNTSQTGIRD